MMYQTVMELFMMLEHGLLFPREETAGKAGYIDVSLEPRNEAIDRIRELGKVDPFV